MSSQSEESGSSSTQATAKKLEKLHNIERDIIKMLASVAGAIDELSKDNPSAEVVEYKTKDFVKTLEGIERGLNDEIQYLNQVSTTQAHEGSVYGIEKDYELSLLQNLVAKDHLQKFVDSTDSKPPHEVLPAVMIDTNSIEEMYTN